MSGKSNAERHMTLDQENVRRTILKAVMRQWNYPHIHTKLVSDDMVQVINTNTGVQFSITVSSEE